MAVYRCKMCGGTIEFEPGSTVGICDSCGTKQTLPKTDSEVLSNLFNRANNLRLKCEFDKAEQIYEKIVEQDDSEAEAHWGIVLCKYGIEYVEDPKTFERIPTCHRTLYEPITSDVDYLATIDYSDASQQVLYEQEARTIDRIQKGILEIVRNEKPFDVFICYKETDENGKRTVDSAIANDIYYQLTQEGLKVFYAPITLEDKVGQEYEPYIFAALNSAKVMLVIGTKPEYFSAVWVKNEWSRFMKLMKTDRSKLLIPCYRDMDAYDLPEEFAHLQAQDMGKIGFINDVVRGIKKVITPDNVNTAVVSSAETVKTSAVNIEPLLKRAFLFLESSDWSSADEYCEKVLDQDPENAQAYLGKLMAELQVHRQEELRDQDTPFNDSNNYQMAVRFGNSALKEVLNGIITYINERNENDRLEAIYNAAVNLMNSASNEEAFKKAASEFETVLGFKDSNELKERCLKQAEITRKDTIYNDAVRKMNSAYTIATFESAKTAFQLISGWKDADHQAQICFEKLEEIKAKEEKERIEKERKKELDRIKLAKERKLRAALFSVILILSVSITLWFVWINPYLQKMQLVNTCKNAAVGSTIEFGSYSEEDNPIEWIILDKQDTHILVICKYPLEEMQFNKSIYGTTWETSSLRRWLNDDFVNEAFDENEKSLLQPVHVLADMNPIYKTNPGNDTTDMVFLLSASETDKYFMTKQSRQCGLSCWWLRSPGKQPDSIVIVDKEGNIDLDGIPARLNCFVRPAMWITFNP